MKAEKGAIVLLSGHEGQRIFCPRSRNGGGGPQRRGSGKQPASGWEPPNRTEQDAGAGEQTAPHVALPVQQTPGIGALWQAGGISNPSVCLLTEIEP
jgi:hypothetical protein